jgi:hypothetical protein
MDWLNYARRESFGLSQNGDSGSSKDLTSAKLMSSTLSPSLLAISRVSDLHSSFSRLRLSFSFFVLPLCGLNLFYLRKNDCGRGCVGRENCRLGIKHYTSAGRCLRARNLNTVRSGFTLIMSGSGFSFRVENLSPGITGRIRESDRQVLKSLKGSLVSLDGGLGDRLWHELVKQRLLDRDI